MDVILFYSFFHLKTSKSFNFCVNIGLKYFRIKNAFVSNLTFLTCQFTCINRNSFINIIYSIQNWKYDKNIL